jgi:hypothetical protein
MPGYRDFPIWRWVVAALGWVASVVILAVLVVASLADEGRASVPYLVIGLVGGVASVVWIVRGRVAPGTKRQSSGVPAVFGVVYVATVLIVRSASGQAALIIYTTMLVFLLGFGFEIVRDLRIQRSGRRSST